MEEISQEEEEDEDEDDGEEDAEVGEVEESEAGQGAPSVRPTPAAGPASRPHLQPFGAAAAAGAPTAGQFDDGDSIVPSTPTLMVPRRDAFAESVPSPQVGGDGWWGKLVKLADRK